MNIKDRVKNKIFKCILNGSVDYHAGGFFVKKQVLYLIFNNNGNAIFYQREEGLHPFDNDYLKLLNEIINKKEALCFGISQTNIEANLLKLSNDKKEILCMPSIFIENLDTADLTEIVLDDRLKNTTMFFSLVLSIDESYLHGW